MAKIITKSVIKSQMNSNSDISINFYSSFVGLFNFSIDLSSELAFAFPPITN